MRLLVAVALFGLAVSAVEADSEPSPAPAGLGESGNDARPPEVSGDLPETATDDYNYGGPVAPEDEWDKTWVSPTPSPSLTPPPPANMTVDPEDNVEPLTADQVEEQDKEEASMFLAIFACIIILVVGFLCVHALHTHNVYWFPEAWVFFSIGILLAVFMAISDSETMTRISFTLHKSFAEIFFVLLLPPIIFESGYSMDKRPFFQNFWAICTYAFAGTLLSTVVVGVSLYAVSQLAFVQTFTLLEAHVFGSIVSATDPVTVLAVFQELRVDRTLYALVFGESVLNDAVAIVLYHTLLTFEKQPATLQSVAVGVLFFFENFLGSLLIGSLVGVLSALLFKHVHLRHNHAEMERCIITLLPFVAYMISEGLKFSGVVAILFAGITMAHYTVRNLSVGTRRWSLRMFKVLATLAEALVFVYIGLATPRLFARTLSEHWFVMVFAVVACLVGRAANVEVCTRLINFFRKPQHHIRGAPKFVVWFSGLRGGVAFALSSAAKNVVNDHKTGVVMEAASLFLVVASMLGIGGSIGPLVRKLDLCQPTKGSPPSAKHADDGAVAPRPAAGGGEDTNPSASDGVARRQSRRARRARRARRLEYTPRAGGPPSLWGRLVHAVRDFAMAEDAVTVGPSDGATDTGVSPLSAEGTTETKASPPPAQVPPSPGRRRRRNSSPTDTPGAERETLLAVPGAPDGDDASASGDSGSESCGSQAGGLPMWARLDQRFVTPFLTGGAASSEDEGEVMSPGSTVGRGDAREGLDVTPVAATAV